VVIAGHVGAIERAIELCKAKGAKKAMALAVSAPFHSALLKPAADRLAADIEAVTFSAPATPIIHNVNAKTETDPQVIKQLMIEQIYHPVLWVDCVNHIVSSGMKNAIECGPGKVLTGLIKRINRELVSATIDKPEALSTALGNNKI
jgi:[acyl-carrier-protein] S-malonyltransferase